MIYIAGNIERSVPDEAGDLLLAWTTEPPTEPGWYWVVDGPWTRFDVEIVRVVDRDGKGELIIHGEDWSEPLSSIKYWLGPLPEPEPPA